MTLPRLLKAPEVCDLAQLQSYVLRSWEKEFPGIGVQKSPEAPRLYRQSDVDQVLRIKQLVFGEGLTLAGARRRLEESASAAGDGDSDTADVLEALSANARTRVASVKQGLRSILAMLDTVPGRAGAGEDYQLQPPRASETTPAPVAARKKRASA
jgi:DNA-binding transcriptional MerR regulator